MSEKALTRGKTMSELYPDQCGFFDDLIATDEEYGFCFLRMSDVGQPYGDALAFGCFSKACLDLKMEYPFTRSGFRDIRRAHRFASRIKHEKLNTRFSQFIAEMDKIPPEITSRASKEDIDDLILGANPDPRILLSLPQSFYYLFETVNNDWNSDQEIHRSAIAIATGECSLEGVDDGAYYTWLAKKIDQIAAMTSAQE